MKQLLKNQKWSSGRKTQYIRLKRRCVKLGILWIKAANYNQRIDANKGIHRRQRRWIKQKADSPFKWVFQKSTEMFSINGVLVPIMMMVDDEVVLIGLFDQVYILVYSYIWTKTKRERMHTTETSIISIMYHKMDGVLTIITNKIEYNKI